MNYSNVQQYERILTDKNKKKIWKVKACNLQPHISRCDNSEEINRNKIFRFGYIRRASGNDLHKPQKETKSEGRKEEKEGGSSEYIQEGKHLF